MLSKKDLEKISIIVEDTIKNTYDSKELEALRKSKSQYIEQNQLLEKLKGQFQIKTQLYVDSDTGQDYLALTISTKYRNKCDIQTCDIEIADFIKSILLLDLLDKKSLDLFKTQIQKIREGKTYEN